jgi:multidrug efflux pump subunit AcrB
MRYAQIGGLSVATLVTLFIVPVIYSSNWFSGGTRPLVDIVDSAVEGAALRLRPITVIRLVAMLGLLPAAL